MQRLLSTAVLAAPLAALSLVALWPAQPAAADALVVNLTTDQADLNAGDGRCDINADLGVEDCTLRAAIGEANFTIAFDMITFSTCGPIAPAAALPDISNPVSIDGSCTPGPRAELVGGGPAEGTDGLRLVAGSDGSTIRDLVIRGWIGVPADGIEVNSDDNFILGNFLGVTASGEAASANVRGVHVSGGTNNTIGGTTIADRNVISGNSGVGGGAP